MKFWQRVDSQMNKDGIPSLVNKYTIHDGTQGYDFYIKTGWWLGRPVFVDITMTRQAYCVGRKQIPAGTDVSVVYAVNEQKQMMLENCRSALEIICRQATLLLFHGLWSLEELSDMWIATQMEPSGCCNQVADENLGDTVRGPIDAAARLIKLKGKEWNKAMSYTYDEEQIEQMIEECQTRIIDEPYSFTGWEKKFIEEVEEQNETGHLSDTQIAKLVQIWEERNCG